MKLDTDFKIDFVGIGAPKCGTTWIYECLQEHPQLILAPKDQAQIAFFFKNNLEEREIKDYKSYLKRAKKGQLLGDFHVWYLTDERVIERIKKHNANVKILVCLRNPIQRAFSHYHHLKYSQNKDWKSFEQAIKQYYNIINPGFYYKHLKPYFDNFHKHNILVLIYEDIKKDKLKFVQKIYRFLGVDGSFVPPSLDLKINLTQFKLTKFGRFIHKRIATPLLKNTKWAWRLKQSPLIKRLLCEVSENYGKDIKKEVLETETYEKLKQIYASDIKKLEELINRDLGFWK